MPNTDVRERTLWFHVPGEEFRHIYMMRKTPLRLCDGSVLPANNTGPASSKKKCKECKEIWEPA